jgi:hypothetical protein
MCPDLCRSRIEQTVSCTPLNCSELRGDDLIINLEVLTQRLSFPFYFRRGIPGAIEP